MDGLAENLDAEKWMGEDVRREIFLALQVSY